MVPVGNASKQSRSAIFRNWVEDGRHEDVSARLVAGMANLAGSVPSDDWSQVVKDPRHADYVGEVVRLSHTARLIPTVEFPPFWTYEYIHMASQNYASGRWFLPVVEKPFFQTIPEETIRITPLDIGTAPEQISAARDRFRQDWEYDKTQVLSRRREWFLFRRQGCRWSLDKIADEFSKRREQWDAALPGEQFFDPDPPELDPSQVGRDIKSVAKLVGLKLDQFRKQSDVPSAAEHL